MREFLQKIPVFVIVIVIVSIVRAAMRAAKGATPAPQNPAAGMEETDDQRRVREIQERIRRIAAERRGIEPTVPAQPPPLQAPAEVRPAVQPIDPFGGPRKPAMGEWVGRLKPSPRPTPPPVVTSRVKSAEAARLEQIRDSLREREEQKFLAARHASQLKEEQRAAAESEAGLLVSAREKLLEDLGDPASVRRAWVLREVLGKPVGPR